MKCYIFCTLLFFVLANCSDDCGDPDDICTLPLEVGMCRAYIIKYGFDVDQNKCVEFVYGGCPGNENNFDTLEECQDYCEFSVSE